MNKSSRIREERAAPASSALERREQERRSQPLRSILYGLFRPRRRHHRRADSGHKHYLDWYSPRLLISTVGVIVCCFADAFFTLELLSRGGKELNPVMDALIQFDAGLFVKVKYLLTCLCVAFLVVHQHFFLLYRIRVGHVIHACFAMYAALICYELTLLIAL